MFVGCFFIFLIQQLLKMKVRKVDSSAKVNFDFGLYFEKSSELGIWSQQREGDCLKKALGE